MDEQLRERRAHAAGPASRARRTASSSLHYQPQAQIGGEIIGFEALVRWKHPNRGWFRRRRSFRSRRKAA